MTEVVSGYLTHLKVDGEAFAVAASLGLDKPVPTCPDWSVATLVRHLGDIHRRVTARVASGDVALVHPETPASPEADDLTLIGWYRDGLEEMLATLASHSLDAPAWTWAGEPVAGFWHRRMAHETAVHRWDAENATSRARPIAVSLAPDGIDEMLDLFLWRDGDPVHSGPGGDVRLRATDSGNTWIVALRDGRPPGRGDRSSAGDLIVRGAASDLLLLLWGRTSLDAVTPEGDESLWQALGAFAGA